MASWWLIEWNLSMQTFRIVMPKSTHWAWKHAVVVVSVTVTGNRQLIIWPTYLSHLSTIMYNKWSIQTHHKYLSTMCVVVCSKHVVVCSKQKWKQKLPNFPIDSSTTRYGIFRIIHLLCIHSQSFSSADSIPALWVRSYLIPTVGIIRDVRTIVGRWWQIRQWPNFCSSHCRLPFQDRDTLSFW